MRAEQVTAKGYYWYFEQGHEKVIMEYNGCFCFCGSEIHFTAPELPGQFIGPITYPPTEDDK